MNIDYENSLKKVLTAIENDLEYITLEELINVSGYSYFHFHRIFKTYTGESLKKYIKRLQMEKALFKMQINHENITQIAMSAGFDTPSSFNKSFKKMFGINPSEYKQRLIPKRKLYNKILPIRFETIQKIDVYYKRYVGNYESLDTTWNDLMSFANKNSLFNRNFYAYAVAYDNPNISDENKLRYDACISMTKLVKLSDEDKIEKKELFSGKYAVFLHHGEHSKIADTYDSIFGEWLFTQNQRLRDVPIIQKFLNNKYEVAVNKLLTEIYVPI